MLILALDILTIVMLLLYILIPCTNITKYHWGDKVKENEMGWACSIHRIVEKCIQDFGWKT